MKICSKCNKTKIESEFNWKIKGKKRSTYCKSCSRKYVKKHYENNKAYYLAKAKERNLNQRAEIYKYLAEYLIAHSCIDCGEKDIRVLEFDHKDRSLKEFEVSVVIRRRLSLQKVKAEIAKCEIRCANCHRKKTATENNSWKLKYAPVV